MVFLISGNCRKENAQDQVPTDATNESDIIKSSLLFFLIIYPNSRSWRKTQNQAGLQFPSQIFIILGIDSDGMEQSQFVLIYFFSELS